MFDKYPVANVYGVSYPRKEVYAGDITIDSDPDKDVKIIALWGQETLGRGRDMANRAQAFRQGLQKIREFLVALRPPMTTIAFPDGIGCGLAGGDPQVYRRSLVDFAKQLAGDRCPTQVVVVAGPDNTQGHAQRQIQKTPIEDCFAPDSLIATTLLECGFYYNSFDESQVATKAYGMCDKTKDVALFPDGNIGCSPLSQWKEADMIINGIHYRSCEQYMMAEKARIFCDYRALDAILAARTPAEAKRQGRLVRWFDEDVWYSERLKTIACGNHAKFSQNAHLQAQLLSTDTRVIAEAAPFDTIWGIGLHHDNTDARDMSKWKGLNLLGVALILVREELKRGASAAHIFSTGNSRCAAGAGDAGGTDETDAMPSVDLTTDQVMQSHSVSLSDETAQLKPAKDQIADTGVRSAVSDDGACEAFACDSVDGADSESDDSAAQSDLDEEEVGNFGTSLAGKKKKYRRKKTVAKDNKPALPGLAISWKDACLDLLLVLPLYILSLFLGVLEACLSEGVAVANVFAWLSPRAGYEIRQRFILQRTVAEQVKANRLAIERDLKAKIRRLNQLRVRGDPPTNDDEANDDVEKERERVAKRARRERHKWEKCHWHVSYAPAASVCDLGSLEKRNSPHAAVLDKYGLIQSSAAEEGVRSYIQNLKTIVSCLWGSPRTMWTLNIGRKRTSDTMVGEKILQTAFEDIFGLRPSGIKIHNVDKRTDGDVERETVLVEFGFSQKQDEVQKILEPKKVKQFREALADLLVGKFVAKINEVFEKATCEIRKGNATTQEEINRCAQIQVDLDDLDLPPKLRKIRNRLDQLLEKRQTKRLAPECGRLRKACFFALAVLAAAREQVAENTEKKFDISFDEFFTEDDATTSAHLGTAEELRKALRSLTGHVAVKAVDGEVRNRTIYVSDSVRSLEIEIRKSDTLVRHVVKNAELQAAHTVLDETDIDEDDGGQGGSGGGGDDGGRGYSDEIGTDRSSSSTSPPVTEAHSQNTRKNCNPSVGLSRAPAILASEPLIQESDDQEDKDAEIDDDGDETDIEVDSDDDVRYRVDSRRGSNRVLPITTETVASLGHSPVLGMEELVTGSDGRHEPPAATVYVHEQPVDTSDKEESFNFIEWQEAPDEGKFRLYFEKVADMTRVSSENKIGDSTAKWFNGGPITFDENTSHWSFMVESEHPEQVAGAELEFKEINTLEPFVAIPQQPLRRLEHRQKRPGERQYGVIAYNPESALDFLKRGDARVLFNAKPHIVGLVETHLNVDNESVFADSLGDLTKDGYDIYHSHFPKRKGYAGVSILVRKDVAPLCREFTEVIPGRAASIVLDGYRLLFVYGKYRGSGPADVAVWDDQLREICAGTRYDIILGDVNISPSKLDVADEDYASFATSRGIWSEVQKIYTDMFRFLYGDAEGHFTAWKQESGYLAKNIGERIDLILAKDARLVADVRHLYHIHKKLGDHCPIHALLRFPKIAQSGLADEAPESIEVAESEFVEARTVDEEDFQYILYDIDRQLKNPYGEPLFFKYRAKGEDGWRIPTLSVMGDIRPSTTLLEQTRNGKSYRMAPSHTAVGVLNQAYSGGRDTQEVWCTEDEFLKDFPDIGVHELFKFRTGFAKQQQDDMCVYNDDGTLRTDVALKNPEYVKYVGDSAIKEDKDLIRRALENTDLKIGAGAQLTRIREFIATENDKAEADVVRDIQEWSDTGPASVVGGCPDDLGDNRCSDWDAIDNDDSVEVIENSERSDCLVPETGPGLWPRMKMVLKKWTPEYTRMRVLVSGTVGDFFCRPLMDDAAIPAKDSVELALRDLIFMHTLVDLGLDSSERKLVAINQEIGSLGFRFRSGKQVVDPKFLDKILEWNAVPDTSKEMNSLCAVTVYPSTAWGSHYKRLMHILRSYSTGNLIQYRKIWFDPQALRALIELREFCALTELRPVNVDLVKAGFLLLLIYVDSSGFGNGYFVITVPRQVYATMTYANVNESTKAMRLHWIESRPYGCNDRFLSPCETELKGVQLYAANKDREYQHLPRTVILDHLNLLDPHRQIHRSTNNNLMNDAQSLFGWYCSPGLRVAYLPGEVQLGDGPSRMHRHMRAARRVNEKVLCSLHGTLRARFFPVKRTYDPLVEVPSGATARDATQKVHLRRRIHELETATMKTASKTDALFALERGPARQDKAIWEQANEAFHEGPITVVANDNDGLTKTDAAETARATSNVSALVVAPADSDALNNANDEDAKAANVAPTPSPAAGPLAADFHVHLPRDAQPTPTQSIFSTGNSRCAAGAGDAGGTDELQHLANSILGDEDIDKIEKLAEELFTEEALEEVVHRVLYLGLTRPGEARDKTRRLTKKHLQNLHEVGSCLSFRDLKRLLDISSYTYKNKDLQEACAECGRCGGKITKQTKHAVSMRVPRDHGRWEIDVMDLPLAQNRRVLNPTLYRNVEVPVGQTPVRVIANGAGRVHMVRQTAMTCAEQVSRCASLWPTPDKPRHIILADKEASLVEWSKSHPDVRIDYIDERTKDQVPTVCLRQQAARGFYNNNIDSLKDLTDDEKIAVIEEFLNHMSSHGIFLDTCLPFTADLNDTNTDDLVMANNLMDVALRKVLADQILNRALRLRFRNRTRAVRWDGTSREVAYWNGKHEVSGKLIGVDGSSCYIRRGGATRQIHASHVVEEVVTGKNLPTTSLSTWCHDHPEEKERDAQRVFGRWKMIPINEAETKALFKTDNIPQMNLVPGEILRGRLRKLREEKDELPDMLPPIHLQADPRAMSFGSGADTVIAAGVATQHGRSTVCFMHRHPRIQCLRFYMGSQAEFEGSFTPFDDVLLFRQPTQRPTMDGGVNVMKDQWFIWMKQAPDAEHAFASTSHDETFDDGIVYPAFASVTEMEESLRDDVDALEWRAAQTDSDEQQVVMAETPAAHALVDMMEYINVFEGYGPDYARCTMANWNDEEKELTIVVESSDGQPHFVKIHEADVRDEEEMVAAAEGTTFSPLRNSIPSIGLTVCANGDARKITDVARDLLHESVGIQTRQNLIVENGEIRERGSQKACWQKLLVHASPGAWDDLEEEESVDVCDSDYEQEYNQLSHHECFAVPTRFARHRLTWDRFQARIKGSPKVYNILADTGLHAGHRGKQEREVDVPKISVEGVTVGIAINDRHYTRHSVCSTRAWNVLLKMGLSTRSVRSDFANVRAAAGRGRVPRRPDGTADVIDVPLMVHDELTGTDVDLGTIAFSEAPYWQSTLATEFAIGNADLRKLQTYFPSDMTCGYLVFRCEGVPIHVSQLIGISPLSTAGRKDVDIISKGARDADDGDADEVQNFAVCGEDVGPELTTAERDYAIRVPLEPGTVVDLAIPKAMSLDFRIKRLDGTQPCTVVVPRDRILRFIIETLPQRNGDTSILPPFPIEVWILDEQVAAAKERVSGFVNAVSLEEDLRKDRALAYKVIRAGDINDAETRGEGSAAATQAADGPVDGAAATTKKKKKKSKSKRKATKTEDEQLSELLAAPCTADDDESDDDDTLYYVDDELYNGDDEIVFYEANMDDESKLEAGSEKFRSTLEEYEKEQEAYLNALRDVPPKTSRKWQQIVAESWKKSTQRDIVREGSIGRDCTAEEMEEMWMACCDVFGEIFAIRHHREGHPIATARAPPISLNSLDLSKAPDKGAKPIPLPELAEHRARMLLDRRRRIGAVMNADIDMKLACPIFPVKRKKTLLGRLVVDMRILNRMCRLSQVPAALVYCVHNVLLSSRVNCYSEKDLAEFFPSFSYSRRMSQWMHLFTPASLVRAVRGVLGFEPMPGITCAFAHPPLLSLSTNEAVVDEFYHDLIAAFRQDVEEKRTT